MDRSLDEILSEREPRGGRGGRGGRRGRDNRGRGEPRRDYERDYPRDGVKKSNPREDTRNIDRDWVHDKYEDEDTRRPPRNPRNDRYERDSGSSRETATIRVENLHYDIQEPDLRELFEGLGPVESLRLLYDRHDRSQGVAYVVYATPDMARRAVRQFDGQNAMGQPIYLTLQQSARPARNPFDQIEKPARSLFDRIDRRSASPDSRNVDRYVPQGRAPRGSRSPPRRRGTPRETGRRPGARRENTGRRGGPARKEGEGRPVAQGRPRKTAEELDAEMDNYWGASAANEGSAVASAENEPGRGPQVATIPQGQNPNTGTTSTAPDDDIDLMVE